MQNLLNFLYRFRTFGLFLILEGFCAWLIISYNNRPNADFLNSSNVLTGNVNRFNRNTADYLKLQTINQQLAEENLLLREQLANLNLKQQIPGLDEAPYVLNKARVINNTFQRSMNYLTLDAGSADGLRPGMGVISGKGVVGQVKSVSENFSTVTSLLHRNLMISSKIKRTGTLGTVQWNGLSPLEAALRFVPRHIPLAMGDSVVTSGFNAVFPEGVMIGTVSAINLEDDDVFYEAQIKLSVDFASLQYVYLVDNVWKEERDSLEQQIVIVE